jgi:transposase-like protein
MPVTEPIDPEVPERAKRRTYSAQYKLRILAEYERCDPGAKGALLRREGLYSSMISEWRKQRDHGALQGLAVPAGRPRNDPRDQELAKLKRDNARLRRFFRAFSIVCHHSSDVGRAEGSRPGGRDVTHDYSNRLSECLYCALSDQLAGRAHPARTIPQHTLPPRPPTALPAPTPIPNQSAGAPAGASWKTILRMGAEELLQGLLERQAASIGTTPAEGSFQRNLGSQVISPACTQSLEVKLGRWRLTPYPEYQNVPGLGLLMPVDLMLGEGNVLAGELGLYARGAQFVYALNGQWRYDISNHVLHLSAIGNLLPFYFSLVRGLAPPQITRQLALSLSPGAGGSFDATNLSDGWRPTLQRL